MSFFLNISSLNPCLCSESNILKMINGSIFTFNEDCLRRVVDIGIDGAHEASFTLLPIELIKPSGG